MKKNYLTRARRLWQTLLVFFSKYFLQFWAQLWILTLCLWSISLFLDDQWNWRHGTPPTKKKHVREPQSKTNHFYCALFGGNAAIFRSETNRTIFGVGFSKTFVFSVLHRQSIQSVRIFIVDFWTRNILVMVMQNAIDCCIVPIYYLIFLRMYSNFPQTIYMFWTRLWLVLIGLQLCFKGRHRKPSCFFHLSYHLTFNLIQLNHHSFQRSSP